MTDRGVNNDTSLIIMASLTCYTQTHEHTLFFDARAAASPSSLLLYEGDNDSAVLGPPFLLRGEGGAGCGGVVARCGFRSSTQRLQRVVDHVVNHDALCVRVHTRQDGGL